MTSAHAASADAQRRRRSARRRRRGPRREQTGAADRRLRREHRDVLSEVEHRPQLVDRRLARAHLGAAAPARAASRPASPRRSRCASCSAARTARPARTDRDRRRRDGPSRNAAPSRPRAAPAQRPFEAIEAAQIDTLGGLARARSAAAAWRESPPARRTPATRPDGHNGEIDARTNASHSRTAPASATPAGCSR